MKQKQREMVRSTLWKKWCRKFALILEKPEIDENLPTPPSWDAKLLSTTKPIESADFPKNGFRLHIKRGVWKFSAHLVRSTPRDFPRTCPEMMKKFMKIMKNSKIPKSIRDHSGSFLRLQETISTGFWSVLRVRDEFLVSGKIFKNCPEMIQKWWKS